MRRSGHLVIVGGGVVGASCAYYARRDGWNVTLIDRAAFGRGCSHGNCGYVCPSHALPLSAPGAIGPALRALMTPNSPFAIRPRLDPALWTWLLGFARRCNRVDMLETARALDAILQSSRRLYSGLMAGVLDDCDWQERGLLFVYQTRAAFEHYAEIDALLDDHFGLGARRYEGDALTALEPALRPGLAGGWLHTGDAHLSPERLMAAWRHALTREGVALREQCAFRALDGGRRVTAVQTDAGPIPAEAVVIATGAWTALLGKPLGARVPIQPGKGYSITLPKSPHDPALPMIFEEHRVAVTPLSDGFRVGSTMEFAGFDESLDPARLQLLRDGARTYLRHPPDGPEQPWFGWRPMSVDGRPLIGRLARHENVYLAAGHGMLGVSMAPATGKLLAELLTGSPPHLDPAPFAPSRLGL